MDVFWHALEAAGHILLQCLKAALTILRSTEFISALGGALGGAFFGAVLAARFESKRRRDEKRDREYEAFLRTQAVIIAQGNSLRMAKDYSFNDFKTTVLGLTRQMVDFRDLAFVARSSDPQLLIELDVANESYDFFRTILEARNAAIQEFLRHPGTRIINLDETTGAFTAEWTGGEAQRLQFNARETNRAVPERLAKAKDANEETMQRLLTFAKKEFPKRQVLHAREESSLEPSPLATGT
jgi:hypothetical protein